MILEELNKMPPYLCRLLARKRKKKGKNWHVAMTHREIAKHSGLALTTIVELSYRQNWSGLTIDTIDRYCEACGVDPMNFKSHLDFMRTSKMKYATHCKGTQRAMFSKLFDISSKSASASN